MSENACWPAALARKIRSFALRRFSETAIFFQMSVQHHCASSITGQQILKTRLAIRTRL
jgi:hypothetical protein